MSFQNLATASEAKAQGLMRSYCEVQVRVGPYSLTEISGHFSSSLRWGFDLGSENPRASKA